MSSALGQISLAVLAGGESRRMGFDKALASFGGTTLLGWMLERFGPAFDHTFLVTKDAARFAGWGVPVVSDALADRGSIVGVYSAVLASPTERVLCLACDMPFVTLEVLRCLAAVSRGHDICVPRHGGVSEPLCAVYSRSALPALRSVVDRGERRIYAAYPLVNTGYWDMDPVRFRDVERLFSNINRPEQLREAEQALARDGGPQGDLADPLRHLAPRVRAFVEAAPLPVVSFVGKKKTGKTTVLVRVVSELVARGYRVAVIKHDMHGFDADVPGRDTYRLREAGATVTGISSPEKQMWIVVTNDEPELGGLIGKVDEPVDLIITEGFKRQASPKIEIARRERSEELICSKEELLGIVSDMTFPAYGVPQLSLDDTPGICDLLEATVLGRGGVVCAEEQGAGPGKGLQTESSDQGAA